MVHELHFFTMRFSRDWVIFHVEAQNLSTDQDFSNLGLLWDFVFKKPPRNEIMDSTQKLSQYPLDWTEMDIAANQQ